MNTSDIANKLRRSKLLNPLPDRDYNSRLLTFESAAIVERIIRQTQSCTSDNRVIIDRSLDVASHFTQGRQYMEAASSAALMVKPLLLYYGIAAFCRGLILLRTPATTKSSLEAHHGLSTQGWKSCLAYGTASVPNLQANAMAGTFTDLARVTGNNESVWIQNADGHPIWLEQTGTQEYERGRLSITLQDVWSRLPDLADLYFLTFEENPSCYPTYVHMYPDVQANLHILESNSALPSQGRVQRAFFSEFAVDVKASSGSYPVYDIPQYEIHLPISPESQLPYRKLPHLKNNQVGLPFLVEPLHSGIVLSTLSLLYLVAFFNGTLARYYPSRWSDLNSRHKDDICNPILRGSSSLVESVFLPYLAKELDLVSNTFTTSS